MADRVLQVPVPKAGKGITFPVDLDELQNSTTDEVMHYLLLLGLKVVLNRGQSKEPSAKDMEGSKAEEQKEKVLAIVTDNWEKVKAGTIRIVGAGRPKTSGQLNVIEMRIARETVKFALKREGYIVSHYKAAQITELAKQLLETEDGEEIRAQAKEELERRQMRQKSLKTDLHFENVAVDPDLVKKAEAKKRKKGEDVPIGVIRQSVQASRREVRH